MKRKERVEEIVKKYTENMIKSNEIDNNGIDALYVSQLSNIDRANASKELNKLWRDGLLIKIQGHPVLFVNKKKVMNLYNLDDLPNTITKSEKLSDYIGKISKKGDREYKIDKMIGSKGALYTQIKDAKAAIAYPPYGLSLLLIGNPGVNKLTIARNLHEYAKECKYKPSNAEFIRIECQNYAENESVNSFLSTLLGSRSGVTEKKGYIESSNKGTIYFDNIDRLNPTILTAITDIIERAYYTKAGDPLIHDLNCTIVASVSPSSKNSIEFLKKYIPVSINIPDIEERGIYEKIENILQLFLNEAMSIKRTIRISKDILSMFTQYNYKENFPQMRGEIKKACSRAFLNSLDNSTTLIISFHHFSVEMISSVNLFNSNIPAINSVLSMIDSDYIIFEPNGICSTLQMLQKAPEKHNVTRLEQFVSKLDVNINIVENLNDFIIENITCVSNCGNTQLLKIKESINPLVLQIFTNVISDTDLYDIYKNNDRLLLGIMLHISNVVKMAMNNHYVDDRQMTPCKKLYPEMHEIASRIVDQLSIFFKVAIPEQEKEFISLYLAIAKQWNAQVKVALLIIGHGEGIASGYQNYLQKSFNNIVIEAIDYKEGMQFNDLLELVTLKCNEIDQGVGILIAADLEPLVTLSEYIYMNYNIRCRTIHPYSLDSLISVCGNIINEKSIDQIIYTYDSHPINHQHVSDEGNNTSPFLYRLTNEFIAQTLTFLDANKAVDALVISFTNILTQLQIAYSNELITKFLCHGVHMIERVIRNDSLSYPKINGFINQNYRVYHCIEENLKNINELYGISIAPDEIAYITEIFS